MTESTPKDPPPPACPRCGGPPQPGRKPTPARPFLTKSKKLTCSLCGLEFEKGDAPWRRERDDGT